MATNKEFEKRWKQAQNAPAVKKVKSPNRVEVDLSLENVLDLYVAHAREAVRENRVKQSVLDNLTKNMDDFKGGLKAVDEGDKLKKFSKNIGSRVKRIF